VDQNLRVGAGTRVLGGAVLGSHREERAAPLRWALALALTGFGAATVVAGGRVLFGPVEARLAAGHYVPWVLWFNFAAGFAYVAAAVGIALQRRWAGVLSAAIAAGTTLVAAALALHVATGGAYERRTVEAMTLRTVVWVAVALWAWRGRRSPDIVGR
jgi:hypothetical protein